MAIKDNFKQSHFIVYELVLPYCSVCTPSGDLTEAWHTPVTCDESSDSEYSLFFTKNSSPIMAPPSASIGIKSILNSSVFRVVQSGNETTPTLKPGEGMASRGTMSVKLSDLDGDPGPINFSDGGTFFGKLKARNVLDGKKILSHYYSITPDSETPEEVRTSTHFIESSTLSDGKFTIKAKDALKGLEAFSEQFPLVTEANITSDIDASTTTIPVNDGSLFSPGSVIKIDKELMLINTISVNNLTVFARGSTYLATDSSIIYKTIAAAHSDDATVQICYVMDKAFLSNVLEDIFDTVGLSAYVNFTQWDDEITEWNSNAFLYGVFHEPKDADDLINQLLSNYMIDMWLDQDTQKAIVSATSTWKQAIRTISEDNDITDLKTATKTNTRFSRAYIYNSKEYQAENDDSTNYSRLTLHKDTATESSDLYGSVSLKEFDPSSFISPGSAEILVSRYVQRFARTPEQLSFKIEERKLAGLGLGSVVDVVTRDSQTPAGEFLEARTRAQLISIKPDLNKVGRMYSVQALSYVPLIASSGDDLVIFVSGTVFDLNLYSRAGAPPNAINITFVFDGATIGSTATSIPAIRAGGFFSGSTLKLIFTDNSKSSARGGDGGDAYVSAGTFPGQPIVTTAENGDAGGDVYQSDGIATDIYLNYGNVDGYDTSAELYAPGGGGGGASLVADLRTDPLPLLTLGVAVSGSGGSGIPGGIAGVSTRNTSKPDSSKVAQGLDGVFNSGGAAVAETFASGSLIATSTGGYGGFSLSGDVGLTYTNFITTSQAIGSGGAVGAAIKGTGVTVYNLAAESSKFQAGNSDSFTLITV